jgi:2-polyprenyl-3-methyl-5-hydroxy-6-metoxy-1,4-benzoquinol methylase
VSGLVETNVGTLGCGSGELARLLADRSDQIDGIEPNPERAENARRYMRKVITGTGGPVVDTSLPDDYDVVIFADVLEHMGYPEESLQWASSKLRPDGRILALIPNSANWKFRRKILKGDWSYADTGYFDPGHLRRLGSEHFAGTRDHSQSIWALLMFDAFLRRVVADTPVGLAEAAA